MEINKKTLPKEKIAKLYKNPNTRSFYKEYNNKCKPDKLLNIAKKGIELYEPLNSYRLSHSNLIDISIISKQLFMITNLNQYRKFYTNIKYLNENSNYENEKFIIYNKFLTKYTINDNILINKYFLNYNIFYLPNFIFNKAVSYNYIDSNFYIFQKLITIGNKRITDLLNFYDYFYFNKNLLFVNTINKFFNFNFTNEIFDKNIIYFINKNFIKS